MESNVVATIKKSNKNFHNWILALITQVELDNFQLEHWIYLTLTPNNEEDGDFEFPKIYQTDKQIKYKLLVLI